MKISEFAITPLSKIITGDCGYTPYLSGSRLVDLFNRHGSRDVYGQGFPSRWVYAEQKLKKINGTHYLAKVLEEIVDPRAYFDTELDVETAVNKINEILSFDGFGVRTSGKGSRVYTVEGVEIKPETLADIENDFLTDQIRKGDDKIIEGDFDGAITNARTMVETVVVAILSKYDKEYKHKGDLIAAYRRIKNLLNRDPARPNYPDSIKQTLSGLTSIVNGLANMRNEMSDAHARRYNPEKRHSKLAVNSAKTLSEFLIESFEKQFRKEKEE